MAERTRAATDQDVLRIVELLEGERVEYALIGGYALALQGIVRLTEDVDILVEPTVDNARRRVRALSKLPLAARMRALTRSTEPPKSSLATTLCTKRSTPFASTTSSRST
jgi:hypothetical protein